MVIIISNLESTDVINSDIDVLVLGTREYDTQHENGVGKTHMAFPNRSLDSAISIVEKHLYEIDSGRFTNNLPE